MKKFTALMLVVLMVVMLVPFGASAAETTWTKVDTAEEFAAMTDGNYWLTADITLPADWTAKDFAGTLNGNGKTVTVSTGAPVFDTVTGTVKNVVLDGTMTLNSADLSADYIPGDFNGYGLGVLANNAVGATIDNIDADVSVTFTNDDKPKIPADHKTGDAYVSFGLIGFATAEFKIEKVTEGETTTNKFTLVEETVINDVVVNGTMDIDFVSGGNRQNMGIILGSAMGGVKLSKCVANANATCSNSGGNKGGIVGYVNDSFTIIDPDDATKTISVESKDACSYVTECLFSGEWTTAGSTGERFGGIVGYGRGLTISKSAVTGKAAGEGWILGIWGYGNANGKNFENIVDSCLFAGDIPFYETKGTVNGVKNTPFSGKFIAKMNKTAGEEYVVKMTNIYCATLDSAVLSTGTKLLEDSGTAAANGGVFSTKESADVAAAIAAFVADNNAFEVKDGALVLKATAFTPEADPADPKPVDPVTPPTGDMTIALVAVAVVSLAAVTVIAKKKVTE